MIWFGDKEKTLAYKPKEDEMIITGYLTGIFDEIEQFAQELPPEVQVAAKFVLVFGSVLGLITMIFLFIDNKKAQKASKYSSEAKGA